MSLRLSRLEKVEGQFGLDASLSVMDKVDEVVNQIQLFPLMFPGSIKYPSVHKAVISKHTSLIYQVSQQEITILFFWDNRQAPDLLEDVF